MFPIIPQKIIAPMMVSSSALNLTRINKNEFQMDTSVNVNNGNNEKCLNNGVFSKCLLIKNSKTKCFSICDTLKNSNLYTTSEKINVELKSGTIQHTTETDLRWIRKIKIANNIYSHNMILRKNFSDKFVIEVLKDIQIGEELILWFSDEIVQIMGIPHLSPVNIQGQNRYWCIKCQRIYENPNPLKIHLAVDCKLDVNESLNVLWNRLLQNNHQHTKSTPIWMTPPDMLTSSSPPLINPTFPPSTHNSKLRPSAFRPITKNLDMFKFPSNYMDSNFDPNAAASNLETIVSNIGTSKQGHLCIYCGKFYSRKYGLKIHIRTHTGFKPLKCKYCLRPFGDPSNLNKHIRLHSQNNMNYKCDLCNKVLLRRRDLERHIQTRHNSRESVEESTKDIMMKPQRP